MKRLAITVALGLVLVTGAGAQSDDDPLTVRRDAAVERANQLREALAGQRPLREALELPSTDRLAVAVAERLAALAEARDARDAERAALQALRSDLDDERAVLRLSVLQAENEADTLERQALQAVLAVLSDRPPPADTVVAPETGTTSTTRAYWQPLLFDSLKLFVIALLGSLICRRVPGAVESLLRFWGRRSSRYHPEDVIGLSEPAGRLATTLVELATAGIALPLAPRYDLLIFMLLVVSSYRFLISLTELAVAAHPQVRPALLTLTPGSRSLLLSGVRAVAFWLFGGWFLQHAVVLAEPARPLPGALQVLARQVHVDQLVQTVIDFLRWPLLLPSYAGLGLLLAFWGLHSWEPALQRALREYGLSKRLARWLEKDPPWLLRAFYGAGLLLLLLFLALRDLLRDPRRRLLETLGIALNDPESSEDPPNVVLPDELVKNLALRECRDEWYLPRNGAEDGLDEAYAQCVANRWPETVIVLGHEGDGKHTLAERWCQTRELAGRKVLRIRLRRRLTTEQDAMDWLTETFEIEKPPSTPVAFAGRLSEQLAEHIILFESFHLAFLRRVGGFEAIRFLLAVISSVQGPCLWVVTMHRPAWFYLAALGGLVNIEVFRHRVELEPLTAVELRQMLLARTEAAGQRVRFSPLVEDRVLSWTTVKRAENEFFQRLYWASKGNPAVALALWSKYLVPRGNALTVSSFVPDTGAVQLPDSELFVLAAIHTHRALTEQEIVEVTNMSAAVVHAAVKNLQGQDILVERSKRFSIAIADLIKVSRSLRRQHIIHGNR